MHSIFGNGFAQLSIKYGIAGPADIAFSLENSTCLKKSERDKFFSIGFEITVDVYIAVAAKSMVSVKQIPNKLINVNILRLKSNLKASFK
jgi:hypothetical protein